MKENRNRFLKHREMELTQVGKINHESVSQKLVPFNPLNPSQERLSCRYVNAPELVV